MKFNKFAFCFLTLSSTVSSIAGTAQGVVTNLFVHTPGVLMFQIGTGITSSPTCSQGGQWAISLSDLSAKPMMALLLSAQSQGKRVYVQGYTNTCAAWPDRELPSYVILLD